MNLHKTTVFKSPEMENPMKAQEKVFNDLLENERKDKRLWQWITLVFAAFCLLGIGGLFYGISLQRTVPVLVAVTDFGESKYLGKVDETTFHVPEAAIQYQVKDFVDKLRSIPYDPDVLYNNIEDCYAMVTNNCESKMTAELRENSPFVQVGKLKREVTIQSILQLSKNSYQVDWTETETGNSNYSVSVRGVFTVALRTPTDQTIAKNPLGIYIDDYSMTLLQQKS